MADDMDAATAALIQQLMLDDMDEISAGSVGPGSHTQDHDAWAGEAEPSDDPQDDVEEENSPNDNEESEQPALGDSTEIDISSITPAESEVLPLAARHSSEPIARTHEESDPAGTQSHRKVRVVDGVIDPVEGEASNLAPETKGKGRALESAADDENIESKNRTDEQLVSQHEDDEDSAADQSDGENEQEAYYCPESGEYYPARPKLPNDWLFEPCTRVWNPTLQQSELHATIPWAFVAATLGIVVEDEDERHGRSRHGTNRGRTRRRDYHSGSAEMIVHEIRLDPVEG